MSLCPMITSKRLNLEEEFKEGRERLNSNLSTSSTPATGREIKRNLKEEFRQNSKSTNKFLFQRKNYLIKENLKKVGSLDLNLSKNEEEKEEEESTSLLNASPKEPCTSTKNSKYF